MSLIEVTVVLGIMALVAALVAPAASGFTRAELRTSSGKLAGTIRATYDAAAMTGQVHRLVFDVGKSVVKVQSAADKHPDSSQMMALASMLTGGGGGSAEPEEVSPPKELLSLLGGSVESGDAGPGLAAKAGDTADEAGLSAFQSTGHDLDLGDAVRVLDVLVDGMTSPQTDGTAVLQFYPHGYTQHALIHLTDEEGTVFTVKVHGLTGRTSVLDQYVEDKR